MRTLGLLLLLGGVVSAGDALDRHPWSAAVRATNRYYEVETNTFPELARSLAGALEEAYALFQDRFGPLEGLARRPMRVALFRTRDEYLTLGHGVEGAIGHFDSALDRCAFVWGGGVGESGWPIAVHEACHHYLRRRHPSAVLPSWYSEGIACYFEGLQDPTTEEAVSRVRIRAAKAALESNDVRIALVLHTRARVSRGRILLQNFTPTRYYALAWSLVHFLATDPATRQDFRRFELRLFASRPSPERREALAARLLEEECGALDELERRWREHLRALPVPPPAARPAVYAWELRSDRPYVRYAALERLEPARLEGAARRGAVECLLDPDLIVRAAASGALADRMDADCVPGMLANLDLGEAGVKRTALGALAHPSATGAVPRLLEEAGERELALEALAAIGDRRAFPALRAAVRDRLVGPRTRARCAAALDADPDGLEVLLAATGDPERAVRTAARAALLRRDGSNLVGHLIRVLDDPGAAADAKVEACAILAAAGAEDAIPVLRRLSRPAAPDRVRLEAARALIRITGDE